MRRFRPCCTPFEDPNTPNAFHDLRYAAYCVYMHCRRNAGSTQLTLPSVAQQNVCVTSSTLREPWLGRISEWRR